MNPTIKAESKKNDDRLNILKFTMTDINVSLMNAIRRTDLYDLLVGRQFNVLLKNAPKDKKYEILFKSLDVKFSLKNKWCFKY